MYMYMCTCSGMHCSSNHVCTCTCAHVVACAAVPIMYVHVHVHIDTYTCLTVQCAMHLLCTPSSSLSEATCGGLCVAVRASMFPSPPLPLPLVCPSLHLPHSHRAQEEGLTTCQSWVCWEAVLALPLVPVQ